MRYLPKKLSLIEQQLASKALEDLHHSSNKLLDQLDTATGIRIQIQDSSKPIEVPSKALKLLYTILEHMSDGKSVSVMPTESELSTQQAADLLNVSRPHLIKLLEKEIIPYRMVGKHRRVFLKDILLYQKIQDKERSNQLDYLTAQAQELNLGYE